MFRTLLFVPFFAIGCASPTSGDYLFTNSNLETDCPTGDDTDTGTVENDPVGVKVNDEGTEVVIAGGDPCPLDGNTYTCSSSAESDIPSYDATIVISSESTGTWVSNSKITGTGSYGTSCTGADCASLEEIGYTFCSSSFDFEGVLEE